MRINRFVAQATGMSRRSADQVISAGRVTVDGETAETGSQTSDKNDIRLDGKPLRLPDTITIMLNKPEGYVVSRDGQGSPTIYELLPPEYHTLKAIGRLDKDSSGLLLLTNNGELANQLTHPRYAKDKIYEIKLDKQLTPSDQSKIERGVELEDGLSSLQLKALGNTKSLWQVTMAEGRNRQIRRTFAALGHKIISLHRTQFGPYTLALDVRAGDWTPVPQLPEA
jgi:23S rRNA pseudouridine2605 synthase